MLRSFFTTGRVLGMSESKTRNSSQMVIYNKYGHRYSYLIQYKCFDFIYNIPNFSTHYIKRYLPDGTIAESLQQIEEYFAKNNK